MAEAGDDFCVDGDKKRPTAADKYVEAWRGATSRPIRREPTTVAKSGKTYTRKVDKMSAQPILDEIDKKVDQDNLEDVLMREGTAKFADPFKALLGLIGSKRGK